MTDTQLAGFADIAQLIAATARAKGDAIAIDDGARAVSYSSFVSRGNRAAHALIKLGVGHGDRIAVLAENCIEYLELAVAAARAGAILCALNWRFTAPELAHCVQLTQPRLLFVLRAV